MPVLYATRQKSVVDPRRAFPSNTPGESGAIDDVLRDFLRHLRDHCLIDWEAPSLKIERDLVGHAFRSRPGDNPAPRLHDRCVYPR
jgi:hypothetical protein